MESGKISPLLILNASAGSGKTYNLVRNYLVLVLKESAEKADPGQVIAMTFTNKAAFEMKTRIIRDLNKLANGSEKDAGYIREIAALTELDPEMLQREARLVLKKVLHRYEDFNVMTIDKFNLRLIRSFSRDLDLPEKFEIIMDESQILEAAIDELLSKVDNNEKNRIYDLAINFARTNLNEETKWNFKKSLLDVSSILTKEQSFQIIRNLIDKEFTDEDLKLWKLQLKSLVQEVERLQRNLQIAYDQHFVGDHIFPGKSRTHNPLVKSMRSLSKEDFSGIGFSETVLLNLEKTIQAGYPEPAESALVLNSYWMSNLESYMELKLKISQFYLLSILRELAIYMEKIRENDAVIRVSEFNKLIAGLLKDEDAPFIYERLGNRFRHFFLDEFQDTSRLQWQNLVPLVHESLSTGKFNLIVGDPKQSIYRFKNGVAEQFVKLPRLYNPESDPRVERVSDYFDTMGETKGLDDNWRSCAEIVRFNNLFFESLKENLSEKGQSFYNHVTQVPRGPEKGLVTFEISSERDKFARQQQELDLLGKWVNECISDGYKPVDICILARKKDQCNLYANHLKTIGYQVVSSDSLLVGSDLMVQMVIAFCSWRNTPSIHQLAMRFAELYFRAFTDNAYHNFSLCFFKDENGKSLFSTELFFKNSGLDRSLLDTSFQDLYSLIQNLLRKFDLNELENAYLHQLLDLAAQFDMRNGPDLAGFLHFYEASGHKTNVELPENESSVRIMTAHKSKGLEFPVVIIPSIKFDGQEVKNHTELIEKNDHFLNIQFTGKNAELEGVAGMIEQEKDSIYIDGINLLYVAFTRPVDRLYFSGNLGARKTLIQAETHRILSAFDFAETENDTLKGTFGSKPDIIVHSKKTDLPFVADPLKDHLWFPDISIMSEQEQQETDLNRQQRLGKQFHFIMEQAFTKEQALKAIGRGIIKGTVENAFAEELKEYANRLFAHELFSEMTLSGKQLDERTLLIDEKVKLRPDKIVLHPDKTIVIDFKTGERKAEHLKQVSDYVFALNMMNYPAIEGYLYYVSENALVKVDTGLFG